jgi:putative flippase GtrA
VLCRWAGLPYLPSTALAVECSVIHNFAWHERWTWADRSSGPFRHRIARLVRFNISNGGISIGGNLILMSLFVGGLGLPYLPANLLSIISCSVANFFAGDRYVFPVDRSPGPDADPESDSPAKTPSDPPGPSVARSVSRPCGIITPTGFSPHAGVVGPKH